MSTEGPYKTHLTKRLYEMFGERCIVVRLDAGLQQGIPDMGVLLEGGFWGILEAKTSAKARRQPNQQWYVEQLNRLCFAAFIHPGNEEAVLNELQQEYQHWWEARVS